MANYYCEYCGQKYSSVASLTYNMVSLAMLKTADLRQT